jgi:putative transposase
VTFSKAGRLPFSCSATLLIGSGLALYQGMASAMPHRCGKESGFRRCVMANPKRNASGDRILSPSRTFFVSTKTSMGKALLQSDRNATLLIDVLRFYGKERKFQLHDFVVMPNHLHLLITVSGDSTVERVMQFIKGGFSYRLKRELGYLGEVWQRGFYEVRVDDRETYVCHQEYIAQNPVRQGLVDSPEKFPYCFTYLAERKRAGAKAQS